MKAISIKQPWATLIVRGDKTIETRTWGTRYRGRLMICSSKKVDEEAFRRIVGVEWKQVASEYPLGKALVVTDLVDCRPMTKEDEEQARCQVYQHAVSWVLSGIYRIIPFSVRGQLGLFDVDGQIIGIGYFPCT